MTEAIKMTTKCYAGKVTQLVPGATGMWTTGAEAETEAHARLAAGQVRTGAGWFWWIAGLSTINSVISVFNGQWSFFVALGVTQIADALAAITAQSDPDIAGTFRLAMLGFNLIVVGLFVLIGWLARRGMAWSFMVGIVLYALDGLLLVTVGEWVGVGFHLFALWWIYGGLRTFYRLRDLVQPSLAAGAADIQSPMGST
jgi:hypothetical protein